MSVNLSFNREIDRPLPAHHGYGMGSTIHKRISLYPILHDEKVMWESTVEKCEGTLKNLRSKDGDHRGLNRAEREGKVVITQNEKEMAQKRIEYLKGRIDQLPAFEVGDGQQSLPVDYNRTRQKIIKRAFESEKFSERLISKDTLEKRRGGILAEVQQTLRNIKISEIGVEPPIPEEDIENISREIQTLVAEEKEVHLIGSFISLPRSKVMDPVVLRKDGLSEDLVKNAHKYSVITEVLLGAYFIGYEERLSQSASLEVNGDQNSSRKKTRSINFNFNAQGTISTTPIRHDKENLLDVYNDWKARLLQDQESGYPIATKVRDLKEIIDESKQTY